jgi:hypothetical protein
MTLVVATFKWSTPGYRSKFEAEHVATLRRMVARHYPHPHRFVLFTDDPVRDDARLAGEGVEVYELWNDLAHVVNPSGRSNPSCYRRLRLFAREVGEWLGPRIVTLDLDTVVTGDLSPVWNRPEDFVIWGDTNRANPYNGSMVLFDAGARPQLWEDFHPQMSPQQGKGMGFFGSDQAWIAARLGPNEKRWTARDGVLSFRNEVLPRGGRLPPDSRIVFFHGRFDPWGADTQRMAPWIREHYR